MPPSNGLLKLNFDAAFDATHFRSGTGLVIRDGRGSVIDPKIVVHIRVDFAFAGEAIACSDMIKFGQEQRILDIIIEGDSITVIKKCRKNEQDKSVISALIQNIKRRSQDFRSISFHHVNRRANQLAHILATTTLQFGKESYLYNRVSEYTVLTIRGEWVCESN